MHAPARQREHMNTINDRLFFVGMTSLSTPTDALNTNEFLRWSSCDQLTTYTYNVVRCI